MSKYASQNFNLALQPGDTALLFGIQASVALAASAGGAVRTNGVVTFTTAAAHHAIPGFQFEAKGVGSVLGTRFDGHYEILTVPSATTLTAQPLDVNLHGGNSNQINDTGGGGNLVITQAELFQAQVPIASIAVSMPPGRGENPGAFSIEIFFDGAPGAFSFQMQEADLEGPGGNPNGYITPAQAAYTIAAVNANNFAHNDLIPTGGAFLRALLNSLTNNVGIIARIRRIQ
jgi:hypothetical protein